MMMYLLIFQERAGGSGRQLFGGMLGSVGSRPTSLQPTAESTANIPHHENTLFDLTYEKKPMHSTADYK